MTTGISMTASELVLVDSSRWLEYITGDERADVFGAVFQGAAEVVVPTIVLQEVFKILFL
jgi:predicted nucleic acid-binding protein